MLSAGSGNLRSGAHRRRSAVSPGASSFISSGLLSTVTLLGFIPAAMQFARKSRATVSPFERPTSTETPAPSSRRIEVAYGAIFFGWQTHPKAGSTTRIEGTGLTRSRLGVASKGTHPSVLRRMRPRQSHGMVRTIAS